MGSSPTTGTTSEQASYRLLRFLCPWQKIRARSFRCSSFSKSKPLRWASIRFWGDGERRTPYRSRRRFFLRNNRHLSLILSRLLPNPKRKALGSFFKTGEKVRFALRSFYAHGKKSECAHSAAPPFPNRRRLRRASTRFYLTGTKRPGPMRGFGSENLHERNITPSP